MNKKPQMKPLVAQHININRDTYIHLKKRGLQHVRHINMIEAFTGSENYTRKLYKTVKLRSVKKLKQELFRIKAQDMTNFSDLLRRIDFRRLEDFNIRIGNIGRVPAKDKDYKFLMKNIRRLTNIKTLTLTLFGLESMKCEFLSMMKKSFQFLKKIENYKFQIGGIQPNRTNSLPDALQGLNPNKLTSLSFHINVRHDLQEFLKKLGRNVKNFPKLNSIFWNLVSQNIYSSRRIEAETICSFLEDLSQVKSLEKLGVSGLVHHAPQTLYADISKLQKLKTIHFTELSPSKEDLQTFAESLRHLSCLEDLVLRLSYDEASLSRDEPDIDDEALGTLCDSLQLHASRLRSFELTVAVPEDGFSETGLQTLSSTALSAVAGLITSCSNLEHLDLFFSNKQDDATLHKLFKSMRNVSHLKYLLLNLKWKEDTNDTLQLELLSEVLLNNPNLRELYIFLNNLKNITDENASNISEAFSKLSNLRLVNLKLPISPEMTEATPNNIVAALKNKRYLEDAQLGFIFEKVEDQFKGPKILESINKGKIRVSHDRHFMIIHQRTPNSL